MPEAAWNFQWRWSVFIARGLPVTYDEVPVAATDDEATREQVAQYNAAVVELRAKRMVEEERRAKAEEKAKETFLGLLSEENRERYLTQGHIIIKGSAGGIYRINFGYSQNVVLMVSGRPYCAYPYAMVDHDGLPLPYHDAMIAQMLMLVANERQFLNIAY